MNFATEYFICHYIAGTTIMCARFFALIVFSQNAVQLHGLVVQANVSWPYGWPVTRYGWPVTQKDIPLRSDSNRWASMPQTNTHEDFPLCGVDDKPLPPKPMPGGIKSVIIDRLLQMMNSVETAGLFPEDYEKGIVISAGAPPNPPTTDYQKENWEIWNKFEGSNNDQKYAKANSLLKAQLNSDYSKTVKKFIEVDGVYEGCSEISYLVYVDNQVMSSKQYGESLRKKYGQDSFLWYEPLQNVQGECKDSSVKLGRNFGLGFGPNYPDGTNFDLGILCEYSKPATRDMLPFACSILGNKMWASEKKPWPEYNQEKLIAKGCE